MARLGFVAAALAAACGGDDTTDTAGDPDLCTLQTSPLPTVEVTDWPEGLSEVAPLYDGVSGRYSVTSSCGDVLIVKIIHPDREQLEVVTTGYPAGAGGCGCAADPDYADDAAYGPVATFTDVQLYVESYPDTSLNARTLDGAGALFAPDDPMQLRFCMHDDIDPVLLSAYDQLDISIRLEAGALTGKLVFTDAAGAVTDCSLSGFNPLD